MGRIHLSEDCRRERLINPTSASPVPSQRGPREALRTLRSRGGDSSLPTWPPSWRQLQAQDAPFTIPEPGHPQPPARSRGQTGGSGEVALQTALYDPAQIATPLNRYRHSERQ